MLAIARSGHNDLLWYNPHIMSLFFPRHILALLSVDLAFVGTEEESSFKQLHRDDSKDKLEQDVHDEDVGHILQGVHHTVKHSL